MGLLGNNNQTPPTRYNGINTAQAILGTTLPLIIGQQRTGWKLLWYGDFKSNKAKQQGGGGSGLAKGGTNYVYSASVIGSVCMGPAANFLGMWDSISRFAMTTHNESFSVGAGPNPTYNPSFASTFRQDFGAGYASNYNVIVNDYGSPGSTTITGTQQIPLVYTTSPTPGPGQYTVTNTPSIGPFNVTSIANASAGNTVYTGVFTGGAANAFNGFSFAINGALNGQNDGQFQCVASTATTITLNNPNGVVETRLINAIVIAGTPVYVFNGSQTGQTVTVIYASFTYKLEETELQVAAASVTVQYQSSFVADDGVTFYPSGIALSATSGSPSAGQYNPNGGNYQFNTADFGKGVSISYTYNNPNSDANAPSSINITFFGGKLGQQPWSYMTSKHPAEALGYSEVAYAASSGLYLGFSPVLPQYNFEVLGSYSFGNGVPDANPADAIYGLLTNVAYKIAFPIKNIDASLLQGNSSAKNQWCATNFFISAVLDSQSPLMNVISGWCEAGQVYISYDEGKLKFIPLVDTSAVAHGVVYNPPTQPVVDLDDNDFVVNPNDNPIQIEQTPWQNRWNRVSVRWTVRTNSYNEDLCQIQDEAGIQQYGLMAETAQDYQFICTEAAAQFAANMRLQRFSAIYTKFTFTLKSNFAFLSPGDVITVTDGQLGSPGVLFGRTPIRITKMVDDPKSGIEIEAENFPWSVGAALLYNRQAQLPSNTLDAPQDDPGDTVPVIFEVPERAKLYTTNKIFIFANGSQTNWGGFDAYVSFNGVDFNFYGTYSTPGRLGITVGDYPIPAGYTPGTALPYLDNVDTLTVNMQQSGAVLQSVTAADRDAFITLSALVSPGAVFSTVKTATTGTNVGTSTSGGGTSGTTGPALVTSGVSVNPGFGSTNPNWSNPTNVTTSGGSFATTSIPFQTPPPNGGPQFFTKWLVCIDAPLLVPAGSGTINNLSVSAKLACTALGNFGGHHNQAQFVVWFTYQGSQIGGARILGPSLSSSTFGPTIYTDSGNPTDPNSNGAGPGWGLSTGFLTPSVINDPTFGVVIEASIGGDITSGWSGSFEANDVQLLVSWAAAGAAVGWANTNNVGSAVSYTTAVLSNTTVTQWIAATSFGFNFPFGFVPEGIVVTVNAYTTSSPATLIASIYWDEAYQGSPKSLGINTTPTDYDFGSPIDEWNAQGILDIDSLNSQGLAGFGVAIMAQGTTGDTIHIDNVRITVYGTSATNLELISYETATLTGLNTYDLTSINRGVYGSYPCDHPSTATFARLDQATIIYDVDPTYKGSTIFFKFCSFNAYGNQLQSLAEVTPYEVAISELSPGAIDPKTGGLTTGIGINNARTGPLWSVHDLDIATSALHGTYGIQNIPAGYAFVGPRNLAAGIPQWTPIVTGGGGEANVFNFIVLKVAGSTLAQIWDFILVDTSGGPVTVTLPVAVNSGDTAIGVKKITSDTNAVTIATQMGDTIEVSTITAFNGSLYFGSDGDTNWFVWASYAIATGSYVGDISIPATTRGDFRLSHGLGVIPTNAQIQLTTNGLIRFQSTRYDATYIYLNASADNLQGYISLWV